MKIRYYALTKAREVVSFDTPQAYTAWKDENDPNDEFFRVDETIEGDVRVSTVLLPIDHSLGTGYEDPVIFETLVFGGRHDGHMGRTTSYMSAKRMHARIAKMVFPKTADGPEEVSQKFTSKPPNAT